jgi:hypothetical protein
MMRLSNQYRVVYRRIAALTDDHILEIYNRYKIPIPDDPAVKNQSIKNMREIEKYFRNNVDPSMADLLTEWVVKTYRSRYVPWDLKKYGDAANFYKSVYAPGPDQGTRFKRIQKFQEGIKEHNEEFSKNINPKNILDFSIEDFEEIQGYYQSDPKVDQLQEGIPEGASLIYNDGTFQIIKATTVESVCHYSQRSRWCTRKSEAAEAYLELSPLYVIFKGGKRYAQYHFGVAGIVVEPELSDPKHKDIYPDDTMRKLLLESKIIIPYIDYLDSSELDPDEDFDNHLVQKWLKWVGTNRIPEIEYLITPGTMLEKLYNIYNLRQQTAEVPKNR